MKIEFDLKDVAIKALALFGFGVIVIYCLTWLFQVIAGLIFLYLYTHHYG